MKILKEQIQASDPTYRMYRSEFEHIFLSVCTLCCLLNNKKMNLAKIFILLLQNGRLRKVFMELTSIDNEYALLKKFLEYDPTLYKSKYIRNYITSCRKPLKK